MLNELRKPKMIHRQTYKSQHYGMLHLLVHLNSASSMRGRTIDITLRTVQSMTKVLYREYTLGELGIKLETGATDEHDLARKVKNRLSNVTGDLYKDFFDAGAPITNVE